MANKMSDVREAAKNEDAAHPIASAWKPILREIISSFVSVRGPVLLFIRKRLWKAGRFAPDLV